MWGSPRYLPVDSYFTSFKVAAQARLVDPIITIGRLRILEAGAIIVNPFQ